jgi:hypothetical protein
LGALSVSAAGSNYQFSFPVTDYGLTAQQVLMMGIDIEWEWPGRCPPSRVPPFTYSVNHDLTFLSGNSVAALVTPGAGVAAGSTLRAIGKLIAQCDRDDLDLSFRPPALMLQGQTTISIVIDLPMHISTEPKFSFGGGVTIPNFILTKGDAAADNDTMKAGVSVQIGSETLNSTCQVSASSTC